LAQEAGGTATMVELIAVIVALFGMVWAITAYRKKKRRSYLMQKYGDENVVQKIMKRLIWQGMSQAQLMDSWGAPVTKDQKIYKSKISETYKYNQRGRNRFGSRVKLENGVVVGWELK
jgi:hypothetical protein